MTGLPHTKVSRGSPAGTAPGLPLGAVGGQCCSLSTCHLAVLPATAVLTDEGLARSLCAWEPMTSGVTITVFPGEVGLTPQPGSLPTGPLNPPAGVRGRGRQPVIALTAHTVALGSSKPGGLGLCVLLGLARSHPGPPPSLLWLWAASVPRGPQGVSFH